MSGPSPSTDAQLQALRVLVDAAKVYPSLAYRPHDQGQRQFHEAPHRIRALFVGNRFGKSYAGAIESDRWLQRYNRWRPIFTGREKPAQCLWICPEFGQFDQLRPDFEAHCFTGGWKWNDNKHTYTWPNGATLRVFSADKDWSTIQGINPDLIAVDEDIPVRLWRELRARSAGRRLTHYIIMATSTKGITWMHDEVYVPWRDHHDREGVTLPREQVVAALPFLARYSSDDVDWSLATAMIRQTHQLYWCWVIGGIRDNPHISEQGRQVFEATNWGSEKEHRVRNMGGFADFTGDGVFDAAAIRILRQRAHEADLAWGIGSSGSLWAEVPR